VQKALAPDDNHDGNQTEPLPIAGFAGKADDYLL
jgi:hypothetical protein